MTALLTVNEIELLIARGEDSKTERKQELYYSRSKGEEAEFIKDLLALVNAVGDGPSYLLIGVEDKTDICYDITPLGLREPNLQQFVRERIEPTLRFSFREYAYDSVKIGIIEIPRSRTRFHLASKAIHEEKGKTLLAQGMIYIRDGTSKRPINASDFTLLRNEIEAQTRTALEHKLEPDRPDLIVSFAEGATQVEAEVDEDDYHAQRNYRPGWGVPEYSVFPRVPLQFFLRNVGTSIARTSIVRITFPINCRLNAIRGYGGAGDQAVEAEEPIVLRINTNPPLMHGNRALNMANTYLLAPKSNETYELHWTAICEGMKTETTGMLQLHVAKSPYF